MTVHINQYFASMDLNQGGEKEWRNYVCNYIMRIDIPGNIFVFMANILPFGLDKAHPSLQGAL